MQYIIGSDEVGYGAWAGPLFVCAVAVPVGWQGPAGLDDSKKYSKNKKAMRALYNELQGLPTALTCVSSTAIDELGVKVALVNAHAEALKCMLIQFPNAEVIVDGVVPIPAVPQARCIPKADATYPAVMAASIIAKVNRDFTMRMYHGKYPHYGFDTNVGYGDRDGKHTEGLNHYGVCPLHRRSYGPIRKLLEKT